MLIYGSSFLTIWNNIDITSSKYIGPFSYHEVLHLQVHSRLPLCSRVEVKINAEGIEVV